MLRVKDSEILRNYEFRTSCHPEEWNDEGSLNLFQNSHSREILRGVYPELVEWAQNDNCETRGIIRLCH